MAGRNFVAERMAGIGASGIRRVFDLAAALKNPINLSIGQPDFDVPDGVKQAMIRAVQEGRNGYTVTRGLPELRARIAADLSRELNWTPPDLLVTCGVSGGLMLSVLATVNPGEEILYPDPYFVSYPMLATLAGARGVPVPIYDDLQLHPERFEAAVTPRTKMIILCSPANPTGVVYRDEDIRALADLARHRDLLIVSDEIYRMLAYDGPVPSVVSYAPERTILLRGFGKSYGMTGWRLGYAAGPEGIINEMSKLQQYTYVCAPQPMQHAAITALDTDMSSYVRSYAAKRELICRELAGALEFVRPGGGFYVFPKSPPGFASASAFVEEAIRREVLIIPGETFSGRDTHFRVSYAAPDDKIRQGCEILRSIAKRE